MKLGIRILAVVMLLCVTMAGSPVAMADRPGSGLESVGSGVQFLGFSDALNKTSFGSFAVAELSGLTYDPGSGVYVAVADRAGTVESHFFTLEIPVEAESLGTPLVTGATILKDTAGVPFNGYSFDAEAIAATRHDGIIIASEGGSGNSEQPEIRRFSPDGAHVEELEVPSRFLIGKNNLSFEGLAVSPNGHSLFAIFEGPLPADGSTSDNRSRLRIIRYEDRGRDGFAPVAEYFYLTEPGRTATELGAVELIALSEDDLLVMERGFVAGQGNTVRIFRVSVEDARDVSQEPALNAPGLVPVYKRLLVDVASLPTAGATSPQPQANPLLDNFEAMALGPELAGGRRVLLLLSDDNASSGQVTRIIALAVPTRDLVGDDDDEDGGNTR